MTDLGADLRAIPAGPADPVVRRALRIIGEHARRGGLPLAPVVAFVCPVGLDTSNDEYLVMCVDGLVTPEWWCNPVLRNVVPGWRPELVIEVVSTERALAVRLFGVVHRVAYSVRWEVVAEQSGFVLRQAASAEAEPEEVAPLVAFFGPREHGETLSDRRRSDGA